MIYLILSIAVILRLISLNQSLWLDEATSALAAKMPIADLFTKFLPGDFHPPLYYLLLKYWTAVFGYSEISLRIPSIIFGLSTVYVIFLVGKKVFGKKIGLIASALLSTSGLAVYYSQEARMYSLAAFLVSLLIYLYLQKRWLYFSIVLLAIGLTDYVALLIIPVFWLLDSKNWKKLALGHLPLVVGFSIWAPVFIRQLSNGLSLSGSNWWSILGLPTLKNAALIPVKFILGRISFDDKILYGTVVVLAVSVFGYLLIKAIKSPRLIWGWLLIPIAFGIILSFKIPTLSYFRFLFCLPALYLLVAYGIERLGKPLRIVALSLVFAINLSSIGYYLLNTKFQREDWRGLTSFVESKKTQNSITVFIADSNMEAYLFYAPNAKIAGPEGVRRGFDQVWLMRYVQEIFDLADHTRIRVESLGYKKAGEFNFNGVPVWEYIKQ